MRQREDPPRTPRLGFDGARLFEVERQRLVANDVDARAKEGEGRPYVAVVGRDDRNRLDAIRTQSLLRRHRLVIVVDAGGIETQRRAGSTRLLGGRGQGAGDKFVVIVEPRRDAVHRADEGAFASAHHAEPDASLQKAVCHGRAPGRPSARAMRASSLPPPAKSSKALPVRGMIWRRMNSAPSRAPSSAALRQHSHSSTAHEP